MSEQKFVLNIGPGRCGTSWMQSFFEQLPNVDVSIIKEVQFFDTNFDKGFDWYLSHFSTERATYKAEFSNLYFLSREAAGRIKQCFGSQCKIIMNLRNPVSLAVSIYFFAKRRGISVTPEKLLDYSYLDIMGERSLESDVSVREALKLSKFHQHWSQRFGQDQIFVFDFEEFSSDPAVSGEKILEFLQLNDVIHKDYIPHDNINSALEAKNRKIGQLARFVAFQLRKLGCYSILEWMKRLKIIRKLFFRVPDDKANKEVFDFFSTNAEMRELVKIEKCYFGKLDSCLVKGW